MLISFVKLELEIKIIDFEVEHMIEVVSHKTETETKIVGPMIAPESTVVPRITIDPVLAQLDLD